LDIRWAIEDPNPGEKAIEAKRIEDMGKEAIGGMLDENLVEAAQTLRALEDGDVEDFYPIEASAPSPEPETSRPSKKARNGDDGTESSGPIGIFSADTIDNLKYYAEMARKQAEEGRLKERKQPSKPALTSLLSGYGSGDDSD
jgi:hypothetical protein